MSFAVIRAVLAAVPRWLLYGVILAALGATAGQTVRVAILRHKLANAEIKLTQTKAAWDEYRAKAADAALAQTEQYRTKERALQARADTAEANLMAERKRRDQALAALRAARADADSMRVQIAAYAAGGGPADDSLAACRDRASTLGDLLAQALRVSQDCAGAAEAEAAGARALLSAWPR